MTMLKDKNIVLKLNHKFNNREGNKNLSWHIEEQSLRLPYFQLVKRRRHFELAIGMLLRLFLNYKSLLNGNKYSKMEIFPKK